MKKVLIGEYLQKKRESQSVTLKRMQEKSGLRKDIILKIEKNEFTSLPSPEHARFLVRQYTEALDLNGSALIEKHADEFPSTNMYSSHITEAENADMKYFRTVLLSFVLMIVVLFIIWIILLQIGSQADIFEHRAIYDTAVTEWIGDLL